MAKGGGGEGAGGGGCVNAGSYKACTGTGIPAAGLRQLCSFPCPCILSVLPSSTSSVHLCLSPLCIRLHPSLSCLPENIEQPRPPKSRKANNCARGNKVDNTVMESRTATNRETQRDRGIGYHKGDTVTKERKAEERRARPPQFPRETRTGLRDVERRCSTWLGGVTRRVTRREGSKGDKEE